MKKSDLNKEQILSVSCPTCTAAVGEPCVWISGGINPGPHMNRELSASEIIRHRKAIDKHDPTVSPEVRASPLRQI